MLRRELTDQSGRGLRHCCRCRVEAAPARSPAGAQRDPWKLPTGRVVQRRAREDATIVDLAVDDLLYSVLRVTPGERCLFCKHPYDADLAVKQRALRWGVPLQTSVTGPPPTNPSITRCSRSSAGRKDKTRECSSNCSACRSARRRVFSSAARRHSERTYRAKHPYSLSRRPPSRSSAPQRSSSTWPACPLSTTGSRTTYVATRPGRGVSTGRLSQAAHTRTTMRGRQSDV